MDQHHRCFPTRHTIDVFLNHDRIFAIAQVAVMPGSAAVPRPAAFLRDAAGVGGAAKSRRSQRPKADAGDIRGAAYPSVVGPDSVTFERIGVAGAYRYRDWHQCAGYSIPIIRGNTSVSHGQ